MSLIQFNYKFWNSNACINESSTNPNTKKKNLMTEIRNKMEILKTKFFSNLKLQLVNVYSTSLSDSLAIINFVL